MPTDPGGKEESKSSFPWWLVGVGVIGVTGVALIGSGGYERGRRKARQNPVSEKPGWQYRVSYETWDEEALEIGETDDKGWEIEDSEVYPTLDAMIEDLPKRTDWLGWSSDIRAWLQHPSSMLPAIISYDDENLRTGERTQYHLFVEKTDGSALSKREVSKLSKALRLLDVL